MAQATQQYNRFHNLSAEQLADAIGHADAVLKGAEAEAKSRGLLTTAGERFTVTRSDQVSSRLDVTAVKTFLGDAWRKFETASITTVIRIRAVQQLAAAA
jgi:multidrug resistance efflux pump